MKRIVLMGVLWLTLFINSWTLAEVKFRHYEQHCVRCHGVALDGKGPDAASLKVPPANFHLYLSRLKDAAALIKTIKEADDSSACTTGRTLSATNKSTI